MADLKIRSDVEQHLIQDIIPFWKSLRDNENGGYFGWLGYDLKLDKKAVKGCILNSRITWFFSNAYTLLKDESLLDEARHGYEFLKNVCWDKENGGVYWSVNYDGTPEETLKHTYNQAFAVYALASYYDALGDEEALETALELWKLIEDKCKDEGGYLEAFDRKFSPVNNEKLSENGVLAERTMNTLLHVLEAYTELYRADPFYGVGDSIRSILRLFEKKIYDPEKQICDVFFDADYHSLIDLESFGHDIETSWLIDRGCNILEDKAYQKEMQPIINGLAEAAYHNAFDEHQNALNNEREGERIDNQKIWWVQAESVVGFYNAYQNDPQKTEYLHTAEKIWEFIQHHVIDSKSGEWIESIPADNLPDSNQALVHPWKCPYHNGRMCMEMIQRLSQAS